MAAETPWSEAVDTLAEARRRVEAGRAYGRSPRLTTAEGAQESRPLARPDRRTGDRPRLRLVGAGEPAVTVTGATAARRAEAAPARGPAIVDPADPRWVLAVRTSEVLQGSVLPPERREALLRLGHVLGLTPFEANLVIAIVQDQARRGVRPEQLTAAAEPDLRMVPRSREVASAHASRWRVAFLVAAGLAGELAAVWLWLG